jgi:hypothetical protein
MTFGKSGKYLIAASSSNDRADRRREHDQRKDDAAPKWSIDARSG